MKRQREEEDGSENGTPNSALRRVERIEADGDATSAKKSKHDFFSANAWTIGGLHPVRGNHDFTVDLNVFNDLVSACYLQLCDQFPHYSQNVSKGMFFYYCGVAVWYRLYAVYNAREYVDSSYFADVKLRYPYKFIIPKPFSKFLDVIGDFTEPGSSRHWKLVFNTPNKDGHFGKMSADTFCDYLSMPSPAIQIAILHQELNLLTDKKISWDCKLDAIHPENCPEDRQFTENVCGFFEPSRAILNGAVRGGIIDKLLSTELPKLSNFKDEEEKAWISPGLVRYVTNYNKSQCQGYPMVQYSNESRYGSILQMGFCKLYNDGIDVQGFSRIMLPDSMSNLIPVFRLRINRDSEQLYNYPYDFPTLDDVPKSWPENINCENYDYGNAALLNVKLYSTDKVNRTLAVAEYVRSFSDLGEN